MMTRRQLSSLMAGLLVLTLTVHAQVKDGAEVQLQAAIKQALVDGDLRGAIVQFKKIADTAKPDVAAEALVRMAECYGQLGQTTEARAAYERVVREFPDRKKAAATAQAWLDRQPARTESRPGIRVEQVWVGKDVNLEGGVFPDGRHLTFVDWSTGVGNLALRDLVTGENRLLTRDASFDAFAETPLPSPDGKQIAYRWGETDKNASIRLIRSDGSNMRVLAHDRHENFLQSWSPDGKYLAATRSGSEKSTRQIVLISTGDGSIKQLKSIPWQSPALGGFSPDGRFLLYSLKKDVNAGDGGIFAIAIDGSREIPLVQGPSDYSSPIWSPDGSRVLFTSDRSESMALWSVRVVNGRPAGLPELLRNNIGAITTHGFLGDGTLYYGTRETQMEAYVAEFDQESLHVATPVLVTTQAVGRNRSPEFSPDGSLVAFLRGPENGPGVVIVRSVGTGEERTLTTLTPGYGPRHLQWFPDGRSLLVHDRPSAQKRSRFRQVFVESGEARVLFEGPYMIWTTALSHDGKSLFYSLSEPGNGLRLMKRVLETTEETELYRTQSPGVGLFGLSMSADGTRLAFTVNIDHTQRAVMILGTEGGAPREIRRGGHGDGPLVGGGLSWTKDGRHLIASARRGPGDEQLAALPTDGGELKFLSLRMPTISSRSLSADGRRLAFTGSTSKQELWVIRNLLSDPARSQR